MIPDRIKELKEKGQKGRAAVELELIINSHPKNTQAHINYSAEAAELYAEIGWFEKAADLLKEAKNKRYVSMSEKAKSIGTTIDRSARERLEKLKEKAKEQIKMCDYEIKKAEKDHSYFMEVCQDAIPDKGYMQQLTQRMLSKKTNKFANKKEAIRDYVSKQTISNQKAIVAENMRLPGLAAEIYFLENNQAKAKEIMKALGLNLQSLVDYMHEYKNKSYVLMKESEK